jgi:hypothetical protein
MNARRGFVTALLVLGVAQSCTNDFDKFDVTDGTGTSGANPGGSLALAGTMPKAGMPNRPPNGGTTGGDLVDGGASQGGAGQGGASAGDAGAPSTAGVPSAAGMPGMGGAGGAEPDPCAGVSLSTDVENCGECGRACATSHVASLECSEGACSSSCATGFANCLLDEAADDGCETPVLTDSASCGGCDNACPGGFVCQAGLCACDGKNDCGNGNGVACVSGLCQCDQAACRPGDRCRDSQGSKACSCNGSGEPGCGPTEACCAVDGCTDIMSDPANCGACERLCTTGFSCSAGTCQCDTPQDCGAEPDVDTGEAGAPGTGAGGAADGGAPAIPGAGAAPPTSAISCSLGLCVCDGTTCAEGQRCLPGGGCG